MTQNNQTPDFLKLFVRHQQEIYAYVITLLPNVHDADDLFQEGMVVMWQKFEQFVPGTNFAAWGVRIMQYEILDYRRRMSRSKQVFVDDSLFELLQDHMQGIQDELPARIEALRTCQGLLDDRSKRILKMRYERNVPVVEIASYLKVSRRHIYHLLGRITDMLLRCMRKTLADGSIQHG